MSEIPYPTIPITPFQDRELKIREMAEQRYMIEALTRSISATIDMGYEKDKVLAFTDTARDIMSRKLIELVNKI